MRLLGKVSYKGNNYQGWQKQVDAPTIQEEIEKVLSKILNTPISIYGSGRTDAGVHAINQTFHFDVDKEVDIDRLKYSVNCCLPEDIYISELKKVDDDFHSRYSAKGKIYRYDIQFGERDVFNKEVETTVSLPTDIKILEKALALFVGKHDFKDFSSKEEDEDKFVREIYKINLDYNPQSRKASITLEGNGFMRYMIRFIIGASLAVAQNKESLDFIKYHLSEKQDREIISYKAPSEGLFLVDVIY